MKKILIYLMLPVLTVCFSLHTFSQKTEIREPGAFSKIFVQGDIDLELVAGKKESLDIRVENTTPDHVLSGVDEQTLDLRLKTGDYSDAEVMVRVTYTDLQSLHAAGQATVWSDELFWSDELDLLADKGGEISLRVRLEHITARVVHGSIIVLAGTTRSQQVEAGSAGTYSAYGLDCEDTVARASSGGKVKVTANHSLEADAKLKGFVGYIGDPEEKHLNTSLAGEILKTYKVE